MPNPIRDMTGQRFGRLTVVGLDHTKPCKGGSRIFWKLKCDCGTEIVGRGDSIRVGRYVSCGCKKLDQLTEHGLTGIPEHKIWCGMVERCHSPTSNGYFRYGGKGIIVCEKWRHDFAAFYAYVGSRPTPKHSIDRYPNNRGNYEPGNVRWATRKEQQRNITTNVMTQERVAEIRSASPFWGMQTRFAEKFNCSPTTIRAVLRGRIWV
jgi:hypothetical protein